MDCGDPVVVMVMVLLTSWELVEARYRWALPLVVSMPVPISTNVKPVADGTAVCELPEV